MSRDVRDYESDISIDENNIEEEWRRQSSLYLHYSREHADAIEYRDRQKVNVDVMLAELDAKIRDSWNAGADGKLTEASLKAKVMQSPEYKKINSYLIKANHRVNVTLSVKIAFEHKKKALESLASLMITGMYSEPKVKSHTNTGRSKNVKRVLNTPDKKKRIGKRRIKK